MIPFKGSVFDIPHIGPVSGGPTGCDLAYADLMWQALIREGRCVNCEMPLTSREREKGIYCRQCLGEKGPRCVSF